MDSVFATQNDEKSKGALADENGVVGEDIISKLHDSILGHILSFLPSMEAIHTSLLSKRWIHVWTSITGLQFNDSFQCVGKKKMHKQNFEYFVNRVLLHLANSTIQSFSLCLTSYQYDSTLVNAWISSIFERGIKNLHIQYSHEILFPSHSLFSCSSLVQLVLQMKCTLCVPFFASLPNLKILNISGIKLVGESSTYSEELILNLPVLRVLEARGCEWQTMQNIRIQAPLLERFCIAIWRSLSDEAYKSSINVFAPCLTDFSYEGDLEQDIILLNSPSIRSASVVIVVDEDRKDRIKTLGYQAHKLLAQILEVQQLKLLFYKVLVHARDIFTHLPAFGRLTYLQLNEVTGEALLNILHRSPILNTLVLQNGVSELNKDVTSASVPQCFLSSLKVFQFKEFNVHEHELLLVKFVMANAKVLDQMTICTAFWLRYSNIDTEKAKQQILYFPKCSNLAVIQCISVQKLH
ncbi:hypothetical protein DEO72_LG10g2202 [Vigna unguiculata]|uniref:FBD domain-containing protein n=1 Tax=Vigna unguiculata TaxID=3917 RepID=A0A4D6NEI8_VIGUN|nr:hypothetical protein DEO72_LG10g2202 [Vigna unguiculata]